MLLGITLRHGPTKVHLAHTTGLQPHVHLSDKECAEVERIVGAPEGETVEVVQVDAKRAVCVPKKERHERTVVPLTDDQVQALTALVEPIHRKHNHR